MNDFNVFIKFRPEHDKHGFAHCRTNVFAMTPRLHVQINSVGDTGKMQL